MKGDEKRARNSDSYEDDDDRSTATIHKTAITIKEYLYERIKTMNIINFMRAFLCPGRSFRVTECVGYCVSLPPPPIDATEHKNFHISA